MPNESQPILTFDPVRVAAWLVCISVTIGLLVVGRTLLVPIAIAFFIWVLLDAIREFLATGIGGKWAVPRKLATFIAIALVLGANYLIVYIVAGQLDAVYAAVPTYQENFGLISQRAMAALGIAELPSVQSMLSQVNLGTIISWLGGSMTAVFSDFALIAIYLGFLIAEEAILPVKLGNLQRDPARAREVSELLRSMSKTVQVYIGMKTAVSALTGLVSYAVLKLVGVDFAALWALLIFFLNFIPNIGSVLGVVFPALLTLVQFDTLQPFLLVTLGLGGAQFVIGNVIEPAYMGKSLNMSSFMILLSLTFWGIVWGLPGMFLSVPLMVVLGIICAHIDGLRWVAVILSGDGQLIKADK